MERSSRFSFRRKNSHHKAVVSKPLADKISYVSLLTAKQFYAELTSEYHLKHEQLAELVGFLCATLFAKIYPKGSLPKDKGSILVCCGPGINGVEGLVCCRHLKLFGYRPTVFYPHTPPTPLEETAKKQCERLGIPFLYYLPSEAQLLTDSYNVIIDSIYGFDFESPIPAEINGVIQTIIRSKLPVISINFPSGWDDDNYPDEPTARSQPSTPINSSSSSPFSSSSGHKEAFIYPETIFSTFVPLSCTRNFKGKNHHLLGHLLLPIDLLERFSVVLPGVRDSDNSTFDMLSILPYTSQDSIPGCASSANDAVVRNEDNA